MSSGPGTLTSTTQQQRNLPGWEQEIAKAYLGAAANLVFPGMKVPGSTWFPTTSGFSFPTGGPTNVPNQGNQSAGFPTGASPQGAAAAQQSGLGQFLGQNLGGGGGQWSQAGGQNLLDPTAAANLFLPMIAGSPYLQNVAAQNPGALIGAVSPAAANQLYAYPFLYGGAPQNPDPAFQAVYGNLARGGIL